MPPTPGTNFLSQSPPSDSPATTQRAALTVVTSVFFMWGFVTVLNDVLVPFKGSRPASPAYAGKV